MHDQIRLNFKLVPPLKPFLTEKHVLIYFYLIHFPLFYIYYPLVTHTIILL